MSGRDVREARKQRGWKQAQLAKRLAVSQGYVSLLERNRRAVPRRLASKLASVLDLSPNTLPVGEVEKPLAAERATSVLGRFGYPGFAHLRRQFKLNPAELLLRTLRAGNVDARLVEALPWVLLKYPNLDWAWLVREAKANDLQNRLGFLVTLARQLAESKADLPTVQKLSAQERTLEYSRLQREDAFRDSLTNAERRWLRTHRPPEAAHWNVLTNLSASALQNAV